MTINLRSNMTVELIQSMGSDAGVVASARVSTQGIASQESLSQDPEEARGLINFLMRNRHGTPFENAGAMTFLIEAPIFVLREWHRHRIGWSYSEWSARYSKLEPSFWIPHPDRPLVQEGKPGHYIFIKGDESQYEQQLQRLAYSYQVSYREYEQALHDGVAKEVARACLPLGIYTSMYASCNPRSLMAFLSLRTKYESSKFPSYPQAEIEECAKGMEDIFAELFPITHECFTKNGRVSP